MDAGPSIGWEIILIFILIVANGVFAMSEIAIVSLRKARMEQWAEEGSKRAKTALALANAPTRLLSTVQVGITLIGIVTGSYGGVTLARELAVYIKPLPLIGGYGDAISMTLVISAITYFSLIIGELVPKKIALSHPERVAMIIALPMRFFAGLASPVVKFLSVSTELVLKGLNIKEPEEPPVTEEEIRILIAQGAECGTFENAEKDIVDRVFRVGDMRVSSLMTPRTQIDWLDLDDTPECNLKTLTESNRSKLPVARGSIDNLVGVVFTRDILAGRVTSGKLDIEGNLQEPFFVPKSMQAFRLLEIFKKSGNRIALVLDEFGGVLGLVTIHDLIEQIVGEIAEQDEPERPDIIQRKDGSWLLDGLLDIEEFKEAFAVEDLPGEDREHFHTLGGFVVSYLGDIPKVTDSFEWNGLKFEVVDMDRIRVDKVLVSKI